MWRLRWASIVGEKEESIVQSSAVLKSFVCFVVLCRPVRKNMGQAHRTRHGKGEEGEDVLFFFRCEKVSSAVVSQNSPPKKCIKQSRSILRPVVAKRLRGCLWLSAGEGCFAVGVAFRAVLAPGRCGFGSRRPDRVVG